MGRFCTPMAPFLRRSPRRIYGPGVGHRVVMIENQRYSARPIQWEARMIKGLHHNAYRCRDSEETRGFYEDFLGLRLVSAFEIDEGRGLHTFFEMDDGSCLAFFEVPSMPFEFRQQNALDLHIALGVEPDTFDSMLQKAKA